MGAMKVRYDTVSDLVIHLQARLDLDGSLDDFILEKANISEAIQKNIPLHWPF